MFTGVNVTERLTTASYADMNRGREIAIKSIHDYMELPTTVDLRVKFNNYRYKLYVA